MRIVFLVSTPYQILLAINIKHTLHRQDEADIYIQDHFPTAHQMAIELRKLGMFRMVKVVECLGFSTSFSTVTPIRYAQKVFSHLRYRRLAQQYYNFGENVYDTLYFTCPAVINQIAIKELFSRNPQLKVHLYEDGTGGYGGEILKTSKLKDLFNLVTGNTRAVDRYDSIMVMAPQLYEGETTLPVLKIPPINLEDRELVDSINRLFGFQSSLAIRQRIIFFEQPINLAPKLMTRIREVADEVLSGDYIVKLHPRSSTEAYRKHPLYEGSRFPWELLSLNSSIEDKILISYYSTALITNKIIFDQEPTLIFLFELAEFKGLYDISEDMKRFVMRLKSIYRDPSKVRFPTSVAQLQMMLEELAG
ncbi:alpha-2,8-polysialyltransferase family protein, partial [Myxococcota bacterium]|nr:alpha-2,8-polysialyltransferase family protein [Myxococcota bacterium]